MNRHICLSSDHVPNTKAGNDEPQNCERKWMEKEQGYFSEVHGKAHKYAYTAILMQTDGIRQFLDKNENLETLEEERDRLDKFRDAFNKAQEPYKSN